MYIHVNLYVYIYIVYIMSKLFFQLWSNSLSFRSSSISDLAGLVTHTDTVLMLSFSFLFFLPAGLWRSTADGSKVRWPTCSRAPTVASRPLVSSNPVLFDLQFRRGWPNRSPWLSPRPCSPPGWVWSSRPRTCSFLWDWTRSPPVALPSYPPADWLLCFRSNRIFPSASDTVAVNVVFLRRPWLALLAALFHCRHTPSFSSLFICISIDFCSSFWPSSVWFYTLVSSSFDFDAHPCIVLGQLVSTFIPN